MTTFRIRQGEFTPAEVELMTGVSVDLQRLWRRRGFLLPSKDGKHARFKADELGYLLALKAFSDAGIYLDGVKEAASVATLPVFSYVGMFVAGELDQPRIMTMIGGAIGQRYIVATGNRTVRASDLATVGDVDSLVKVVFDCEFAATVLLKRAPRPLISLEITSDSKGASDASSKPRVSPSSRLRNPVRRK